MREGRSAATSPRRGTSEPDGGATPTVRVELGSPEARQLADPDDDRVGRPQLVGEPPDGREVETSLDEDREPGQTTASTDDGGGGRTGFTGSDALGRETIDEIESLHAAAVRAEAEQRFGLLKGRRAILFTNQGTPSGVYENNGMTNSLKQTSDAGILKYCGLDVLEHKFFGGVPTSDPKTRETYLEEVIKIIKKLS